MLCIDDLMMTSAAPTYGLPSGAVFYLDAGNALSWPGSGQVWRNLIEAPADGAQQGAYDFYLGEGSAVDTHDPGFSGSVGASDAYWSFNSNHYFTLPANTPFINSLHKEGFAHTVIAVQRNIVGQQNSLLGTGGQAPQVGFAATNTAASPPHIWFGTPNGTTENSTESTIALANDDAWSVEGYAWNQVNRSVAFYNSGNYEVKSGPIFTSATAAPSFNLQIGAQGGNWFPRPGGSKIAAVVMWNRVLSQAEFDTVRALLGPRYGA